MIAKPPMLDVRVHFENLMDSRRREPTYPLLNVVGMTLCSDDSVAIASWSRKKEAWLAHFLDRKCGQGVAGRPPVHAGHGL